MEVKGVGCLKESMNKNIKQSRKVEEDEDWNRIIILPNIGSASLFSIGNFNFNLRGHQIYVSHISYYV